jgi:hypothetical protein
VLSWWREVAPRALIARAMAVPGGTAMASVVAELVTDFSELAAEARRGKRSGFSGQISGLFVGGQPPDVRAAVDAAEVALGDIQGAADPRSRCQQTSVRPRMVQSASLAGREIVSVDKFR